MGCQVTWPAFSDLQPGEAAAGAIPGQPFCLQPLCTGLPCNLLLANTSIHFCLITTPIAAKYHTHTLPQSVACETVSCYSTCQLSVSSSFMLADKQQQFFEIMSAVSQQQIVVAISAIFRQNFAAIG